MKVFNQIIIIANTLLFLAVGAFGISISATAKANKWTLDIVENFIEYLNISVTARIIIFSLGLFLILVALMTIIGNIEKMRVERTVTLESPLGEIMVSLASIEDFSRIVKNQISGVKDIKGRVLSTRKGLSVTAHVTLFSNQSIADVTQEIQEAIIKYIQYTLGIAADIKPTVVVSKVVYKTKEAPKNE